MVFVPTHQAPDSAHEPATAPRRPEHAAPPSTSDDREHLSWRAVVHMPSMESVATSWHLTACSAPLDAQAHCPRGQELMQANGDPDGHCLVHERCMRCEQSPN